MLTGIMYLGANMLALYVLAKAKYYRLWPLLCAQIAATCWQIGVILVVPLSESTIPADVRRLLAIHWWLPGETVLLALTAGAIMEALWRAMAGIPKRHKCGVLLSLI